MKKIIINKNRWDYDFAMKIAFLLLVKLIIGLIFLIPPILGAIFFICEVYGMDGNIISLNRLSGNWTGDNGAMSAAPIYLGLMALAGSYLTHSGINTFIYLANASEGINTISGIEIEE